MVKSFEGLMRYWNKRLDEQLSKYATLFSICSYTILLWVLFLGYVYVNGQSIMTPVLLYISLGLGMLELLLFLTMALVYQRQEELKRFYIEVIRKYENTKTYETRRYKGRPN